LSTSQLLILIVIVVVVLVAVGIAVSAGRRKKRTAALQGTFGSEYDRTVEQTGGRKDAERELAERKAKHDSLDIRPLTAASRQRYTGLWAAVQARFVDDPVLAFTEADHLLTQLMQERGYPTGDVQEQAGLLSVEHGRVLENYRAGHAIEERTTSTNADTEQARQGMLHFRTVFEELLDDDTARGSNQPEAYPAGQPERSTDVEPDQPHS